MSKKNKIKVALKWIFAGLPLGAVAATSFFPLQPWVQQAMILITLLWFFAFYLFDCLYLGG